MMALSGKQLLRHAAAVDVHFVPGDVGDKGMHRHPACKTREEMPHRRVLVEGVADMGTDRFLVGIRPVNLRHVDATEKKQLALRPFDDAGRSFSGVGPCQTSMPISTMSSQISSAWQSQ